MGTPVSQLEILKYRELREIGYPVREAARMLGRAPSSLFEHDHLRRPRAQAPDLETAIALHIESALVEGLLTQDKSSVLDAHPIIKSRIRSLCNAIMRIISRNRSSTNLPDGSSHLGSSSA